MIKQVFMALFVFLKQRLMDIFKFIIYNSKTSRVIPLGIRF